MAQELSFAARHRYHLPDAPAYEGGFSVLYKALDLANKRTVAVKVIDTKLFAKGSCEKEVTMLCKVNEWTTNVSDIYTWHLDPADGKLYIVMQWLPGKTLRAHMDETPRPRDGLRWMRELCEILVPLHKRGYQHRDLKPENIQISPGGHVFLMDFNISLEKPTLAGGTPDYAAPEMMEYYAVAGNRQVDVFAIGAILYELLCGAKPLHGATYSGRRDGDSWTRFIPPSAVDPTVPEALNSLVVRCMELDPRRRYAGAGELLRALAQAQRGTRHN